MGAAAVAGVLVFCNTHQLTRVVYNPALRESFATPVFPWQLASVVHVLMASPASPTCAGWIVMVVAAAAFAIPWQFAPFILCCEVVAIYCVFLLGFLNTRTTRHIVSAIGVGAGEAEGMRMSAGCSCASAARVVGAGRRRGLGEAVRPSVNFVPPPGSADGALACAREPDEGYW